MNQLGALRERSGKLSRRRRSLRRREGRGRLWRKRCQPCQWHVWDFAAEERSWTGLAAEEWGRAGFEAEEHSRAGVAAGWHRREGFAAEEGRRRGFAAEEGRRGSYGGGKAM